MSKKIEHIVSVDVFDTINELPANDQLLLKEAIKIGKDAYAPYSKFYVGAAIRLKNGKLILGSNQENVAYPSGLCAERVAIYYANATFPNEEIDTIAIHARADNFEVNNPISPCGSCRQAIAEYEIKQEKNIRIIMSGEKGKIHVSESLKMLLPFMFNEQELKNN